MKQVLKYPGSKWGIARKLLAYLPPHHSYVEPYFGSGALLFNKSPSHIETVNDLDCDVVNLFLCIQEDPEKLARLVMTTPYSREMYDSAFGFEEFITEVIGPDPYRQALVFLIKCWQGYGYRTNGNKVGWRNDIAGRERAYALRDWLHLPEQIIGVAERLRTVQIENRPALEVIERFNYINVFQYLDPPYLLGTRNGKQYKHEMTDKAHEDMLKKALKSKAKIMISGYESDMYNDYLKGWKKAYFKSQAESAKPRQEVVWMNYEPPVRQMNFMEYKEDGLWMAR